MPASDADPTVFDRPADVLVVGSGPVGLRLALALGDAGVDVLLLESGTEEADPGRQALADAESLAPGHAAMALATRRAFGGTSWLWGGRAVPFDPVDFACRPDVPEGRWPIGEAEVAPWLADACRFLDCGPPVFAEPWPGPEAAEGLVLDRLERWAAEPRLARVHGARVRAHPRIRVVLGATATDLIVEGGRVAAVRLARGDKRLTVRPRAVALAAGGLETARLLLGAQAESPALFGGPEGALGRFYMGHLFGSIADIVFLQPGADRLFDFRKDDSGRYIRRRLALSADLQRREDLLNAVAWPELAPLHDPRHRSGILSLAYLALATPGLGSRLSPEAIRRRKLGPGPVRPLPHLANLVRDALPSASFALRFLQARHAGPVRLPGFFVTNPARRYDLHVHAEQAPDRASRVGLGDSRNALGQRRLRIEHRFGERDARSFVRTVELLADRLAAAGLARVEHRHRPEDRVAAVLHEAGDGFHQVGTARMGDDPRRSVVDGRCRVHGVSNLYLAGSAVFPSSGQANPTLLALALSARLGAELAAGLGHLPEVPVAKSRGERARQLPVG